MARLPVDPSRPIIVQPSEGERHTLGPSTITHKLDGSTMGGRFAMIEYSVAPRFVAPTVWHWHTKESWVGYVAAGKLLVAFPDHQVEVPTGGVIVVPPNCPFAWSNPSDEPARLLNIYSPAGFEDFFREVSAVAAAHPGVTAKDLGPQLLPLWQKYGIENES